MRDKQNDSSVAHCKVVVQQNGNSYVATYSPPIIPVKENGAVIRFKLDQPTPDDVIIDTVTIAPSGQTQLTNLVISDNGKQFELTDANTVRESFNLTFTFKKKKNARSADSSKVDTQYPQIDNDPPGMDSVRLEMTCEAETQYPQIDNDPPG